MDNMSPMLAMMLSQQPQQPQQAPDATSPPSPLAMQQAMAMSKQGGPGVAGGLAGGLQGALMVPGMREKLAQALQSGKGGVPPAPGMGSAPALPGGMAG